MTTPQRPAHRKRGSSISQALSAIPLNTNTDNSKTLEQSSPTIEDAPGAPLGAEQSQAHQSASNKVEPVGTPALQLNGSEQELARDQDAQAQLRQRKKQRASASSEEDESVALKQASRRVKKRRGPVSGTDDARRYISDGFWSDLRTGKWMLIPRRSWGATLVAFLLIIFDAFSQARL